MVITNTLKLSGSKESNRLSKVISVHLHHILTVPDNVKLSKDFMINIKTSERQEILSYFQYSQATTIE